MLKIAMTAIALVASVSIASAQALNNSGNQYRSSGSTVYGNNFKTGSNWNTRHSKGGAQHGIDKRGNAWNYNSKSGIYNNYGTGQTKYRGKRF